MTETLFFQLFLVFFAASGIASDGAARKIPNWLVVPGAAAGILLNAARGFPQFLDSSIGLLLAVGIFLIPFALGWLGGGDIKFLGAIGAILGARMLPRVLFYSALLGGLMALISVIFYGRSALKFKRIWLDLRLLISTHGSVVPQGTGMESSVARHTVPYGVAIGLGTLVAFFLDARGYWAGF